MDFGSKDVGCAILDLGYQVGGKSCVRENRRFSYVWELSYSAGVGKIYVFAMLRAFVGENASEPLQVSNKLSPLQLHLNLFDHDLVFGQLR